MFLPRTVSRWLAVLIGLGLGPVGMARADAVYTSPDTQFSVGIGTLGNLYSPPNFTGFVRNADGFDPIFGVGDTLPRESWGVSNGAISGYVDPNGVLPPSAQVKSIVANSSPPATPMGAFALSSTFLQPGSTPLLQIDQAYYFAANNVLKIAMTITNLDPSSASGDVLLRRNVDWAIPPWAGSSQGTGSPNQFVNYPAIYGPVTSTTADGLAASPDPLVPYYPDPGFPDTDGGGTFGPAYIGAGLTYDAGILAPYGQPGDSVTVNFFYGDSTFGQSYTELSAQVAALGGNFVIAGYNSADPTDQAPADINSAVLAVQVQGVPEPATLALLTFGLAGLACWPWRRRIV